MALHYIMGDATAPTSEGNKIIAHVCNDIGAWGRGFVLALSKKWPAPEDSFKRWYKSGGDFCLGKIQLVQVEPDLWIANMVGQHNIKRKTDPSDKSAVPPVRYEAISLCLEQLAEKALTLGASVHMPRIGCGLAGGKWELIEPILVKHLIDQNISVFVYDFE